MEAVDPIRSLTDLGFTQLEAEIYAFLLQESPATGYRVAQALGKPAANTYKAIESLAGKGAVLVEEGSNRQCRAVPAEELLGRLERGFKERRARASEALASLRPAAEDDRVYQLRSLEQVLERGRAMLARAREIVMADFFPAAVEALRPDLEAAAARGLKVAVQVYQPAEVEGARVVTFPRGLELMDAFSGQWIILVVDGAEYLLAFLSRDGRQLQQAVWTGSPFLAHLLYCYMVSEFTFCGLLADPETPGEVRQILGKHRAFYPFDVPGFQALAQRRGAPESPASTD